MFLHLVYRCTQHNLFFLCLFPGGELVGDVADVPETGEHVIDVEQAQYECAPKGKESDVVGSTSESLGDLLLIWLAPCK